METQMWLIGARLKAARKAAGVTLKEAGASAGGVGRSAVSNWEAGRSMPSLLQFRALIALYGVTGYFILFGEHAWELTPAEAKEMARLLPTFPPDLQRKVELLLTLLAMVGADQARGRFPSGALAVPMP